MNRAKLKSTFVKSISTSGIKAKSYIAQIYDADTKEQMIAFRQYFLTDHKPKDKDAIIVKTFKGMYLSKTDMIFKIDTINKLMNKFYEI